MKNSFVTPATDVPWQVQKPDAPEATTALVGAGKTGGPAASHDAEAGIGGFDDRQLFRLLDLAGPDVGRDLLDRLISDLCQVKHGLAQARVPPDWEAVRGHSHVLISLAGAVGATRLQANAEALNLLSHQMDRAALDQVMPGTLSHLGALITVIRRVSGSYPGRPE